MTTTDADLFGPAPSGTTDPDRMGNDGAFSVDGKPDRWGRYRLPHPVSGRVTPYTRVTTFAKSIADTFKLSQWQQRMAIKGVTLRPDLYAAVAAASLDDKDALNKLVESAKEVAGAKTAAGLGTALHAFSEQYDRGENPVVPAPWDRDIAAYAAVLEAGGITIMPGMIEQKVICQRFTVAGTFDRLVTLAVPCPKCGKTDAVGDLKTGRDLSYGWNEIAIQLALYGNADAIWDLATKRYVPMPDVCKCTAVVIHLPVGMATATLYDVDIAAGWEAAELCQSVRQWRKNRALAVPRTAAHASPDVVVVQAPSWTDRIAAATTRGELSAIWREASAAHAWNAALEQVGKSRLAAIEVEMVGG